MLVCESMIGIRTHGRIYEILMIIIEGWLGVNSLWGRCDAICRKSSYVCIFL